jgi:trimethylamine:corrinoid methyltransferase-like protein
MVKRIKRGYEVNPDTLAFVIVKVKEVGPGGHFLDKDHTFDHFLEPGFISRSYPTGMIISPGTRAGLPRA